MILKYLIWGIFFVSCQGSGFKEKMDKTLTKEISIKNNNTDARDIIEIHFYLASYGDSAPTNELTNNITSLLVSDLGVYKVISVYEKNSLIFETREKLMSTPKRFKKLMNRLSDEYLSNRTFGNPNATDDGSLGITLVFENKKEIHWELSFYKEEFPKQIQDFYGIYEEITSEFEINLFELN